MAGGYDIYGIMQDYKSEESKEESLKQLLHGKGGNSSGNSDDSSMASELASAVTSNQAEKVAVRNAIKEQNADDKEAQLERLAELQQHRDIELGSKTYDIDGPDYQKALTNKLVNALTVKNAQKVIIISNRENMRKGLNREMDNVGRLIKGVAKNQTSTITIPTQLLRYVQQEVGALSIKATQNDIMTGFLYWYFGKPEDITFDSDDVITKMEEILGNLDLNASPAKFNRLNYNASNTVLDKLDVLSEQMDIISSLMTASSRETMDSKAKTDKMYIALCYNILNMLAFTPPVMPGDTPADIDLLANGGVWDLMTGVDTAYDYFKTRNGREIYKSKIRKKVNKFEYNQTASSTPIQTGGPVPPQMSDDDMYEDSYSDYDSYDDYDDSEYEDIDMTDYYDDSEPIIMPKSSDDDMGLFTSEETKTLEDRRRDIAQNKALTATLNVKRVIINGDESNQ